MTAIRSVVMIRPGAGGVAHVARSCAGELRARGVEVTELVGVDQGSPAVGGLRRVWRHRGELRTADVVHLELGITAVPAFWIGAWAGILRGGFVTIVHDDSRLVLAPGSGLMRTAPGWRDALAHKVLALVLDRPLRAWMARRTKVWVSLSQRARSGLEASGLTPALSVEHGADPPTAQFPPSLGDSVVYAGFISPAKGLDVLVDAWEKVGMATSLRLVVVGSPAPSCRRYADGLRARLAAMDAPVTWKGWVDDDDFHAAIATAAVVVVPYRRSNPLSGIVIRAAVEGRAIVGTAVPAVTDFLEDGVTGVVVQADNADQLAEALLRLAADPRARDDLGRACARWAADHCTWVRQVDQLLGAYRR
jgi:glycosyltransferase involved in cell wall biosynthesis